MEIKAKYKVLFYNGKKGSITIKHEVPEFEEKTIIPTIKIDRDELVISVEEQVDEWLCDLDKRDIMNKNDIEIIFDWEIKSIKKVVDKKKEELIVKPKTLTEEEMVILFAHTKEMANLKNDFLAVYYEIKDSIKTFKFNKQCEIVMSSLKVAQKASINTLDRISNYKKALKLVNWEAFKDEDGEYDMKAIGDEAKRLMEESPNLLENE